MIYVYMHWGIPLNTETVVVKLLIERQRHLYFVFLSPSPALFSTYAFFIK